MWRQSLWKVLFITSSVSDEKSLISKIFQLSVWCQFFFNEIDLHSNTILLHIIYAIEITLFHIYICKTIFTMTKVGVPKRGSYIFYNTNKNKLNNSLKYSLFRAIRQHTQPVRDPWKWRETFKRAYSGW